MSSCSPVSFEIAYGESGAGVMVSTFGSVGVSPYAEELAAKTSRRTLAWRAASSTTVVPWTLASIDACGSSTERATEGIAASWKTTSTPFIARSTSAASTIEPSTISTSPFSPSTLDRRPVEKSSRMRTRSPLASSFSAIDEPMNPAPPVTR